MAIFSLSFLTFEYILPLVIVHPICRLNINAKGKIYVFHSQGHFLHHKAYNEEEA